MNVAPPMSRAAAPLRERLDRVLLPGDPGYDRQRRVWNADIDRFPAAIVSCHDAAAVSQALLACRELDLEITVRGGGHNLAGTAVIDGAVMIDLSPMTEVVFDDDDHTVTVGAGSTWGHVDRPANDRGVVVPAGVVSHTGVAGLTLGGGSGYLSRLYGATVDHLVGAEVVVADGRVLEVSADEHPELFWGLRGAGHNFAIATRFVFRYVPLTVTANVRQMLYAAPSRRDVLHAVSQYAPGAPDEITTYARLLTAPPYWSQVPTAHRGAPIISVATVHYGDPADTERLTDPLFSVAPPIWTAAYSVPHVQLQHLCDDEFRHGLSHYWKHMYLNDIDDAVIDTAIAWADRYPGRPLQAHANVAPQMVCPFEVLSRGGELARVEESTTAMTGRDARWSANIAADWEYPEERGELVAWAKAFADEMAPQAVGSYINFTSVAGDETMARAIYGDSYERLSAIKGQYDPENVFRRGLADLTPQIGT